MGATAWDKYKWVIWLLGSSALTEQPWWIWLHSDAEYSNIYHHIFKLCPGAHYCWQLSSSNTTHLNKSSLTAWKQTQVFFSFTCNDIKLPTINVTSSIWRLSLKQEVFWQQRNKKGLESQIYFRFWSKPLAPLWKHSQKWPLLYFIAIWFL